MEKQSVGMPMPLWSDMAISEALEGGSATEIAKALALHPRFVAAIQRGIANPPTPGMVGLNHAQIIVREVIDELQTV
jgi:hypothetical protein